MGFLKYLLTFECSSREDILRNWSVVPFITGIVLWILIFILFIAVASVVGPWLFLIPIGLLIHYSHKFYEGRKKDD